MQAPCFIDLKTFKTEVRDGQVFVDLEHAGGNGGLRQVSSRALDLTWRRACWRAGVP